MFGMFLTVTFFFCLQEIKKAILSDMTKLGKEAGLKSFEQVTVPHDSPKYQGHLSGKLSVIW